MTTIKYQIDFIRKFLTEKRHITLISTTYINSRIPLKCKCNVCNHEWAANFANLKFGQGCPRCGKIQAANKHRMSMDNLYKLFLSRHIIPLNLEEYKTAKTPLLYHCKNCEHEWVSNYSRIVLEKKGCPNCKRHTLSQQKTLPLETVQKRLDKQGIILKDLYINATTPIKCQCKNCGYEWISCGFNTIMQKQIVCQNCCHISLLSEKICRIIMENIFNDKFIKCHIPAVGVGGGKLELDGYNDILKIAFEHNGPQHYSPTLFGKSNINLTKKFKIQCQNDNLKREWCKSNGIILITLRELGRYTTEKNIMSIIKHQLLNRGINLPNKIDTYIPRFNDIKKDIITLYASRPTAPRA